ncbi:GNAT family N-acetyltransferase [Streptomyces sp. DT24]|uniref:GNAT family N-acetyltransferase n=1 Tax=Streptomyces sp. DT24 TaxID=3416520 RepID=UPI003CE6D5CC
MVWEVTHDVDAFRAAAGGYLAADPVRNTVLLTVAATVSSQGPHAYGSDAPARFGWWRGALDGVVAGAFAHTPPHHLQLGPMPDSIARTLVRDCLSGGPAVIGVGGGARTVRSVADEWAATGGSWSVHREQRCYQLGDLVWAQPRPAGAARTAEAADVPLVARWFAEFAEAIGEGGTDVRAQADDRVASGRVVLWEADGAPVSMAGFSSVVAGQGRLAPVYTPPELRGRGYAGAATCAASEALRAAGAERVLLFTDLANPTSNALYQRLGYRPVEDSLVVDLWR